MPLRNSSSRNHRHKLIITGTVVVLVTLVVIIASAVVLSHRRRGTYSSETSPWNGSGTTEHLQEIILGRCYNYIATVNPALKDKDCLQIWERLQNAFAYKDPCSITEKDYLPLMGLTSHSIPCNKSLFWSGTKDLVHRYTKINPDFITLEDTLLGYIADGISWCGTPSSPGINYQACPKWRECENNSGTIFWKLASKRFAEAACGTVQVMLNGSTEAGAFRNNSYFGGIEVVNLNPNKVSMMQIWLMHDTDRPPRESCTGRSIAVLKSILESQKIRLSCEDDYRPVQLLQCASDPDLSICRICPYTVQ